MAGGRKHCMCMHTWEGDMTSFNWHKCYVRNMKSLSIMRVTHKIKASPNNAEGNQIHLITELCFSGFTDWFNILFSYNNEFLPIRIKLKLHLVGTNNKLVLLLLLSCTKADSSLLLHHCIQTWQTTLILEDLWQSLWSSFSLKKPKYFTTDLNSEQTHCTKHISFRSSSLKLSS